MSARIATLLLAVCVMLASGGGCSKAKPIDRGSPSKSEGRARRADDDSAPRAGRLELVEVVDDASVAVPDDLPLPPGISLEEETAPSTYARVVHLTRACDEGEMPKSCGDRLQAFASTLRLPAGGRLAIEERKRMNGWYARTWVVRGAPIVTGTDIADVRLRESDEGVPFVSVEVELRAAGRDRFAEFTGSHIKSRIAILANGRVESVPVVQSRIDGGTVQITMGSGDVDEQRKSAELLVEQLRGD